MRDPHYRKILDGLAGPLDPQLFEECAVDLLRDSYPGLVPVRGGQDAGMDGAISDEEGEPYPLVATTSEDILRNVTESLDSYLNKGGRQRKVVVATAKRLTPTFQRKVRDLARDKGFVLVNLHERSDLADRLYRNSRWAKDLLDLSGQPSALSALPPESRRPLLEIDPIGRDADLRWLRETLGDHLIVGQPGSGKTYLLMRLVREDGALFLASDDPAAVASAVRDHEPTSVLVDDAHVDPERLARLRHLRHEISADFAIIANTWPGAEDEVADALGIGNDKGKIRRLELLTREEILKVLRAVGVMEPDDDPVLHLLVDQSANKPGLAVLLGSLWLRGEAPDVLTGKAIRDSLIPSLERILGHDPTRLLACFALGGDAGVPMDVVREFLTLSRDETHRRATLASQGGVLRERPNGDLVVEPEALRFAVIKEIFFNESKPTLPYRDLFDALPGKQQAVETLVLAARRGVQVPRDELQDLISSHGTPDAWRVFALLGRAEAEWVFRHYSGALTDIAGALLDTRPRLAVRRLIEEATTATGPVHSQPTHPLRILDEWSQGIPHSRVAPDPVAESLRRRKLVIQVASEFLRDCKCNAAALGAMLVALTPRLESTGGDATGHSFSIRRGLLPPRAIEEMKNLWCEARGEMVSGARTVWSEFSDLLHAWVWPEVFGKEPEGDELDAYRGFARQVVCDLVPAVEGSPGQAMFLEIWANRAGLALDLSVPAEFRILFPSDDDLTPETWQEKQQLQKRRARDLAEAWALEPASEVATRLAFFEGESQYLPGHLGDDTRRAFFSALAARVEAPGEWFEEFIDSEVNPAWLSPLLDRVCEEGQFAEASIRHCLGEDRYAWLGAYAAIRREELPDDLLVASIATISPNHLEIATLRKEIPLRVLRRLLADTRPEISMAAAYGEWASEPRCEVREEVEEAWRHAVLTTAKLQDLDSYRSPVIRRSLKGILSSNAVLAFAWLRARLEVAPRCEAISRQGVYAAAVNALEPRQRVAMFRALGEQELTAEIVVLLVADSSEMYRHLLAQDHLRSYHLEPLGGRFVDATYRDFAILALGAGHPPDLVAGAAFMSVLGVSYSGFGVEHWSKWVRGFESLLTSDDEGLKEVAQHGLERAMAWVEEARQEHRRFELTGR